MCVKDREASHVQYLVGGVHIAGCAQYFVSIVPFLSSSAFTFLQSGYYISSAALSAGSREDN